MTKNSALGDTEQNWGPVRLYFIYNNSLLSEAYKGIYPFQCLATDSIAKQFAFKEFMRGVSNAFSKGSVSGSGTGPLASESPRPVPDADTTLRGLTRSPVVNGTNIFVRSMIV